MAKGDNFKGNKPTTSGRAPGTANKSTQLVREILSSATLLQQIEDGTIMGPLAYLMAELNNPLTLPAVKRECAKILLPYTDKRKPTQLDSNGLISTGELGFNIKFIKPDNES